MRQLIFRFFFGADEIARHMFALLQLRRAAVARHAENKRLAAELSLGTSERDDLKVEYGETRAALESAYRLELV